MVTWLSNTGQKFEVIVNNSYTFLECMEKPSKEQKITDHADVRKDYEREIGKAFISKIFFCFPDLIK